MSTYGLDDEIKSIGLVLPIRQLTFDAQNSTFTTRNERAGVPNPEGAHNLAVSGFGPSPASTIQVRTQQGGSPGVDRGCSFVWRYAGGEWYGDDPVSAISGFRNLLPAKTGENLQAVEVLDALGFPDGSAMVLCYVRALGSPLFTVRVIRVSAAGEITTQTVAETPDTSDPAGCICRLPNGKILVYIAVEDTTAELLQVRMYFTDDTGENWYMGADNALDAPLPTSGSDNVPYQMSCAVVDATISLFLSVVRAAGSVETNRNQAYQFVSRDGGSNLVGVWQTDEERDETGHKAHSSVSVRTTATHNLVVLWIGEDGYAYSTRLGSPVDPLDANRPVSLDDSRAAVADGAATAKKVCSLVSLPSGQVLALTETPLSGESAYRAMTSTTEGDSWGSAAAAPGDSGILLRGFTLSDVAIPVPIGPGIGIVTQGNGVSWTPSAYLLRLGGPSTLPLPTYFSGSTSQRTNWLRSWDATSDPDDQTWMDVALTGTATYTATEEHLSATTASGANNFIVTETYDTDEFDAASFVEKGIIRKFTLENTSMSVANPAFDDIQVLIEAFTGTERVAFAVRVGHQSVGLRDVVAGATTFSDVGDIALGTEYDYFVVYHDGAGRLYIRETTPNDSEPWTLLIERSITSTASATAAGLTITWGAKWNGETRWRWSATAPAEWTGTGLPDPYSSPGDLVGRPWSSAGVPVGFEGTRIRGEGVTYRGDSWLVSPDSDVRMTNALIGGPRMGWEAAGTTEQVLDFVLSNQDTALGSDILVVAGFGSNVSRVKVEGVPHTGTPVVLFNNLLSASLKGLAATVRGRSAYPNTSEESASAPLAAKDELAGSYFAHYNGGDSVWESSYILGNREGKWADSTPTPLVLDLVDDQGASSDVEGQIVPKDWALELPLDGARFAKIRVTVAASSSTVPAPPEGYWRIGRLFLGYAVTQAILPSWGDRVTHEPMEEVVESRDGQRTGVIRAPTRRLFRLGFVDGSNTYRFQSPTYEGNPAASAFFGVDDSPEGLGIEGMEVLSLDGVLRAVGGAGEMVYLSSLARASKVHNRRDALALVYFDSNTARERIGGFTMPYGDGVRGDTFDLTEAT